MKIKKILALMLAFMLIFAISTAFTACGEDTPTVDAPTADEPTADEPTTEEPTTEEPSEDENALTIELYNWTSADEKTKITATNRPLFNNSIHWEPGYTAVKYLSVKNIGSLPVSFKIVLDVTQPDTPEYSDCTLADVLRYELKSGYKYGAIQRWLGGGVNLKLGINETHESCISLASGEEFFFAISVHMVDPASAIYMHKEISIDVNLLEADESTTEEPTVDEPTTEEPTVEEPTIEEPTTEEPTAEDPTTEDPTTEEPTTEDPTADEPTTDEPSEDENALTIELYNWTSAGDKTEITNMSEAMFSNSIHWEPGYTAIKYLSAKNIGSLPVNFKITLDVTQPDTPEYSDCTLADVLRYELKSGYKYGDIQSWLGGGVNLKLGINETHESCISLASGEEFFFAISVHMVEYAEYIYMNKEISIDVNLIEADEPTTDDPTTDDPEDSPPTTDDSSNELVKYGLHFYIPEGFSYSKNIVAEHYYTDANGAALYFNQFDSNQLEDMEVDPKISVYNYMRLFMMFNGIPFENATYDAERNVATVETVFTYDEYSIPAEYIRFQIMRSADYLYIITAICPDEMQEEYSIVFNEWFSYIYVDNAITKDPTADEPTVDEPTVDKPTTDEPTVDEPTTDDPTTDDPTTDDPTTDDPEIPEEAPENPEDSPPTTDESTAAVTQAEWDNAFLELDNCEIKTTQSLYVLIDDEWVFSQGGVKVEDYVITKNGYLRSSEWNDTIYVRQNGVNYKYKIYHKNDVPEWKRTKVDVIPSITTSGPIVCLDQTQAKFADFTYDEEAKIYVGKNLTYIDVTELGDEGANPELVFETVTIGFEDGKITSFSYAAIIEMAGYTVRQVIEFTFDNYGNAELTLPTTFVEK